MHRRSNTPPIVAGCTSAPPFRERSPRSHHDRDRCLSENHVHFRTRRWRSYRTDLPVAALRFEADHRTRPLRSATRKPGNIVPTDRGRHGCQGDTSTGRRCRRFIPPAHWLTPVRRLAFLPGLRLFAAVGAASSIFDTAVCCFPTIIAVRPRPTVDLTSIRTAASVSPFASIGLGTPFIHDCLPIVSVPSISRRPLNAQWR